MTFTIVLVEDDEILKRELKNVLVQHRYNVILPEDFVALPELVKREQPHLILMDINLPGVDGFHLCSSIREFSAVPIVFLTARSSDIDELMGLTLGGDDYITKPYNTAVLLARISSILSRAYAWQKDNMLQHNGVSLNVAESTLEYRGERQPLTKNELKILYKLFTNPGRIVSRYEIIEYLWDNELYIEDNTLSVNITRIRQKLSQLGLDGFITTKKAQGYMI